MGSHPCLAKKLAIVPKSGCNSVTSIFSRISGTRREPRHASGAKREEEIWVPERPEPLRLSRKDPALQLIQRVRDEAHRFAITRHRGRRSKRMRETSLKDIPGVGPVRARTLLTRFGSLAGVASADPREVEDAVGAATARAVRDYLEAGRPRKEPLEGSTEPGEGGRTRSA